MESPMHAIAALKFATETESGCSSSSGCGNHHSFSFPKGPISGPDA